MGGVTTSVKEYSPKHNSINDYIKKEYYERHTFHEIINENNYMNKLRKYNLSKSELKIVKSGFHCISRKNRSLRKYYFMKESLGIFRMKSYDINIITNDKNEKEIKIIKNALKYDIDNPYVITEKIEEGWGILFFYNSKSQVKKEKRILTLSEIENIKKLMKERLEHNLLSN